MIASNDSESRDFVGCTVEVIFVNIGRRPFFTHRVSIVNSYAGLSPLHRPTTPYLSSTFPDLETGNEIDTIGKLGVAESEASRLAIKLSVLQ